MSLSQVHNLEMTADDSYRGMTKRVKTIPIQIISNAATAKEELPRYTKKLELHFKTSRDDENSTHESQNVLEINLEIINRLARYLLLQFPCNSYSS